MKKTHEVWGLYLVLLMLMSGAVILGSGITQEASHAGSPLRRLRQGELVLAADASSIPPIDVVDAMRLDPDERPVGWQGEVLVLGVAINGEARAYPVPLLSHHEVVNDVLGGEPIAVTWCPLCYSPVVFHRFAGRERTFEASGYLYRNNLVMLDRETGTLWSQLLGQALRGALRGMRLVRIPAYLTTWSEWQQRHPNSTILANLDHHGGVVRDPYEGYYRSSFAGLLGAIIADQRLAAKTIVVGVDYGLGSFAVPLHKLSHRDPITMELQHTLFLLYLDPLLHSPVGFRLDATERLHPGRGPTGFARSADLVLQARMVPVTLSYWFAWLDHNPDTQLFHPDA